MSKLVILFITVFFCFLMANEEIDPNIIIVSCLAALVILTIATQGKILGKTFRWFIITTAIFTAAVLFLQYFALPYYFLAP